MRPVCSAAMIVVPLPAKPSRISPPRLEQSRIASATSRTGLTVGCMASASQRSLVTTFWPAYSQTLVRFRP